MSLLRDGTVVRRYRPQYPIDDALSEGLSGREVATIEDVTQTVEGLNTTITFTFKAAKGEEVQPSSSRPSTTGYTILCAEDNMVNQRKQNEDLAMPIMDGREATSLIRAFESSQPGHRRALIVGLTAYGFYPTPSIFSVCGSGFDLLMSKPFRLRELYEMFVGGPETNIVMLYGSLTEEEKSAYPRLLENNTTLGDDPRSNAIRIELKRRMESDWVVDSRGIAVGYLTKIIVKVVEAGEDEKSSRMEN
ncbi:hypothetical protein E0Z10_g8863 [Xylaria hypoxylon]|uniref:Response regulatory domain-containing protein n=1 Tax=Xylaria hypoxylon TaxID=37992 RepID=A0A4Z0YA88_9PEZI|nr:hypothetical protein E0Z10_g8863 [Xylaria hypoxylon]